MFIKILFSVLIANDAELIKLIYKYSQSLTSDCSYSGDIEWCRILCITLTGLAKLKFKLFFIRKTIF